MDVIAGGRVDCGIGAGWKRDEWQSYGFGFPETKDRLGALADQLEILTRMLRGDRHDHATWKGRYWSVADAINVPKPVGQPRMPIMVGGNGRNVTWRLAARFADELNVDGFTPADLAAALPTIHARCEEVDRDPATLAVSVHIWGRDGAVPGQARVDRLGAFGELGVSRGMALLEATAGDDEVLPRLAEDARAAGLTLG